MKSLLTLALLTLFLQMVLAQQKTIEGVSGKTEVNITKAPPVLSIVENSIKFTDSNGNNCIDANETCKISFTLQNTGFGDGLGLKVLISTLANVPGVGFLKSTKLNTVKVGDKMNVEIPIVANMETTDGIADFTFKVDEPSGFGTNSNELSVKTLAFVNPWIKVVDYSVTSTSNMGNLVKVMPFDLQLLVQNTKYGKAENVNVALTLPENIIVAKGEPNYNFSEIQPGETKNITYTLMVSDKFQGTTIPVNIKITEKYGKYAENKSVSLTLNQALAASKIEVKANLNQQKTEIVEQSLNSDVDKFINTCTPVVKNPNAFAVIIGNKSYQFTKSVDFALNDAQSIKNYLINVMGYDPVNIFYLPNATKSTFETYFGSSNNKHGKLYNNIKQNISDVFIFYSGHGAPGLKDNGKGYFVPVDCDPQYVEQGGYPLELFYSSLSELPAKSITVVTDACFSGINILQNISALAKIAPLPSMPSKCVLLSSSKGEQPSSWYNEKQHGIFTYFFLKAMQDKEKCDANQDGIITYTELFNYLSNTTEGVPYFARSINGVEQNPTLMGITEEKIFIKYKK